MAHDAKFSIDVVARQRDVLGESPVYLAEQGVFAWVDIGTNRWFRLDLSTGKTHETQFETALTGFAAAQDGSFVGAFADGIAAFDRAGSRGPWLHQPEAHLPDNRFNDAGTDPKGRFIAGSMNMSGADRSGALYALGPDGLRMIEPNQNWREEMQLQVSKCH